MGLHLIDYRASWKARNSAPEAADPHSVQEPLLASERAETGTGTGPGNHSGGVHSNEAQEVGQEGGNMKQTKSCRGLCLSWEVVKEVVLPIGVVAIGIGCSVASLWISISAFFASSSGL